MILLAPKGEQLTEHYSFYAAFSSQEEFRVVTEGRTLGSMPVNRPLAAGSFVIFGGRRWLVTRVSQADLVIEVKPGSGGALPSFEGESGAILHDRVREEMRVVLAGTQPVAFLDRQGQQLLAEARANYSQMGLGKTAVRQSGNYVQILLWKGDRIHDSLTLLLQHRGFEALSHGLFVEVRGRQAEEVTNALREITYSERIDPTEVAASVEIKVRQKWDSLLAEDVLNADFATDKLDIEGTRRALRGVVDAAATSG